MTALLAVGRAIWGALRWLWEHPREFALACLGAAVLALFLAGSCVRAADRARDRAVAAAQQAEKARDLEHAGAQLALAAADAKGHDLAATIADLTSTNGDLAASKEAFRAAYADALAKIAKAGQKPRPVIVIQGSTGSLPSDPHATPTGPVTPEAQCLYRAGDKGAIDLGAAVVEADGVNWVLAASGAARRTEPTPSPLFEGAITGPVTFKVDPKLIGPPPEQHARWPWFVGGLVGGAIAGVVAGRASK